MSPTRSRKTSAAAPRATDRSSVFVGLLRAVNVGGTGRLSMADLVTLCKKAGFVDVKTYIQSGNVVFRTTLDAPRVKAALERAVAAKVGKPVGILLRTSAEMQRLAKLEPFPGVEPNRVLVLFLDEAPARGAIRDWPVPGNEELSPRGRELFIHFPDGMGRSKLKIPFADRGTGRNLNTVRALAVLARDLEA